MFTDMSSRSPSPPGKKRKRDDKTFSELEVDVAAPEPPSKKALRRAKKGRPATTPAEKPGLGLDDDTLSTSGDEPAESVSAPPKRSEHGIWIGNLPWTATKADIQTFFTRTENIGETGITRVHMPGPSRATIDSCRQRVKPQNKGFAYVDFSTKEAHKVAIGLSETLLTGRRVLIKDAKSFEGRPVPKEEEKKKEPGHPPSKRIFIGNLQFDTTQDELREHFARCGDIATVFVATFEDSGKCKGYAWVTFDQISAAEKAVRGWVEWEDDGSEGSENEATVKRKDKKPRKWWVNRLKGRQLRMEFAEDQAVRYKKRFGKSKEGINGAEMGQDGTGILDVEDGAKDVSQPARNRVPKPEHKKKHRLGADTRVERKVDARTIKPAAALANVKRLTGGIVPGTGKKVVFD